MHYNHNDTHECLNFLWRDVYLLHADRTYIQNCTRRALARTSCARQNYCVHADHAGHIWCARGRSSPKLPYSADWKNRPPPPHAWGGGGRGWDTMHKYENRLVVSQRMDRTKLGRCSDIISPWLLRSSYKTSCQTFWGRKCANTSIIVFCYFANRYCSKNRNFITSGAVQNVGIENSYIL